MADAPAYARHRSAAGATFSLADMTQGIIMIDDVPDQLRKFRSSMERVKSPAGSSAHASPAIKGNRLLGMALCLTISTPLMANGPNLLTNPMFDSHLAGWNYITNNPPIRLTAWAPADADGSITSGSMKLTTNYDNLVRSECIPVVAGSSYVMKANVWIPAGNPPTMYAVASVAWYDNADCSGSGGGPANSSGSQGRWVDLATIAVAPPSALSARIMLHPGFVEPISSPLSVYFDNVYFGTGTCAPSSTRLCLNQGRFQVEATWTTRDQTTGPGMAVPFGADSGSFWFFSPTNIELDVKVLDGCVPSLGNHYWVFAAGLTDVHVVLTVTDTKTGDVRTYINPQGTVFQPITDTKAFATCP